MTCDRTDGGRPSRGRARSVVRVGRRCGENPPRSLALVIEVYDRNNWSGGPGPGTLLLFPNGFFDGFSPQDLTIWNVTFDHHVADLAQYEFRSASRTQPRFPRGPIRRCP